MAFSNPDFGQIRVVEIDGESWLVAADVCRALEVGEVHVAMRRLDDDEKGRCLIPTPGGNQDMSIINEPGLYSLVLGSRKPEAKAFKRWITHEVIPSIRKHGGYIAGQEQMSDEELMAKALMVAQNEIITDLKRLAEKAGRYFCAQIGMVGEAHIAAFALRPTQPVGKNGPFKTLVAQD